MTIFGRFVILGVAVWMMALMVACQHIVAGYAEFCVNTTMFIFMPLVGLPTAVAWAITGNFQRIFFKARRRDASFS